MDPYPDVRLADMERAVALAAELMPLLRRMYAAVPSDYYLAELLDDIVSSTDDVPGLLAAALKELGDPCSDTVEQWREDRCIPAFDPRAEWGTWP